MAQHDLSSAAENGMRLVAVLIVTACVGAALAAWRIRGARAGAFRPPDDPPDQPPRPVERPAHLERPRRVQFSYRGDAIVLELGDDLEVVDPPIDLDAELALESFGAVSVPWLWFVNALRDEHRRGHVDPMSIQAAADTASTSPSWQVGEIDPLGSLLVARSGPAHWRGALATQSGAPVDVLLALASDPDASVRARLATHPSLPIAVAERLARDRDEDVVCALATNRHTPPPVMADLTAHPSFDVRSAAAANPALMVEDQLAICEDPTLQRYLAMNPAAGVETLTNILETSSRRPTWMGRRPTGSTFLGWQIAQRREIPAELLVPLITRGHPLYWIGLDDGLARAVRNAIRHAPVEDRCAIGRRADLDLITPLLSDHTSSVRAAIAANTHPTVLDSEYERFLGDDDPSVRAAACGNDGWHTYLVSRRELLRAAASDADSRVRASLASNRLLKDEPGIVSTLASDPSREVRRSLLSNPTVDAGLRLALSEQFERDAELDHLLAVVQARIEVYPAGTGPHDPAVVEWFVRRLTNAERWQQTWRPSPDLRRPPHGEEWNDPERWHHTGRPPLDLRRPPHREEWIGWRKHVRALVAADPTTPWTNLFALHRDSAVEVRESLAGNPRAGRLATTLARDRCRSVRLRVARNLATDDATLRLLVDDECETVADAAAHTGRWHAEFS